MNQSQLLELPISFMLTTEGTWEDHEDMIASMDNPQFPLQHNGGFGYYWSQIDDVPVKTALTYPIVRDLIEKGKDGVRICKEPLARFDIVLANTREEGLKILKQLKTLL